MFGMLAGLMVVVLAMLVLAGGLRRIGSARTRSLDSGPGVSPEVVERLESAIAALETRVDALQDQQRFLERLLADRPPRRGLPGSASEEADREAD